MEEHGQPERLFAGKYKSPEDLEQGYSNLFSLSSQTFQENQALRARVEALERGHTERLDPAERVADRSASELEEVGVPIDALDRRIEEKFSSLLNPVFQGVAARQQIVQRYPDYDKEEQRLAEFIGSDPQLKSAYQRAYQAEPAVAMEWAWTQFQRARGEKRPDPAAEEVSRRLDAMIQGGSDRGAAQQIAATEGEAAAWEHFKRTGDAGPLVRLRTQATVPAGHFDPLPGAGY